MSPACDNTDKIKVGTLVLLPVGPRTDSRFLTDTVASFIYFANAFSRLVLVDDTRGAFQRTSLPHDPRIIWLEFPANTSAEYSTRGAFWGRQATVIRALLKDYSFDILLRIDDDSLFIKSGFEQRAAEIFSASPRSGLVGQFRLMPDGSPVSTRWPAEQFQRETHLRHVWDSRHRGSLLSRWRFVSAMRRLGGQAASRQGWQPGDHVTGGGYFVSAECLRSLSAQNLLPAPETLQSDLCDDHLMSLAVQAGGFAIKECGGPRGLVAYRLDHLPLDYTALVAGPFAIIHSVRRHGPDHEAVVREQLGRLTRPDISDE